MTITGPARVSEDSHRARGHSGSAPSSDGSRRERAGARPNIVILIADDMAAHDCGAYPDSW